MSDVDSESIVNVDEITPEMIEAGLRAWHESAGDEYPRNSITNDLTVIAIFRAMAQAAH